MEYFWHPWCYRWNSLFIPTRRTSTVQPWELGNASNVIPHYSSKAEFNTLRPKQNGRHFADDIFKCIFLNENAWISVKISPKFVPKGPIKNIPALVQIMAWRRPGEKPLSEPMVSLPTHICVTRPQWVKLISFSKRDYKYRSSSNLIGISQISQWYCYFRTNLHSVDTAKFDVEILTAKWTVTLVI